MHEHIEPKDCEHELQYCKKCDVVYCEKCKKEWKAETVYIYSGITSMDIITTPNPNKYWYPQSTAG